MIAFEMEYKYQSRVALLFSRWIEGRASSKVPETWSECSTTQIERMASVVFDDQMETTTKRVVILRNILNIKGSLFSLIDPNEYLDLLLLTSFAFNPIKWRKDRYNRIGLFRGPGNVLTRYTFDQFIFSEQLASIYMNEQSVKNMNQLCATFITWPYLDFRSWMIPVNALALRLVTKKKKLAMIMNYNGLRNSFSDLYSPAFEQDEDAEPAHPSVQGMKGLRIALVEKFGPPEKVGRTRLHDIFTELVMRKDTIKAMKKRENKTTMKKLA